MKSQIPNGESWKLGTYKCVFNKVENAYPPPTLHLFQIEEKVENDTGGRGREMKKIQRKFN